MDDPAYSLLQILTKKYSRGGRNETEKCFSYKLFSARIPIENSFGRLKARFRSLPCAMDVKLNTLTQVIYSCFALHNYCKNKKENLPDQNLMSALSFQKRTQSATISLSYGERVNENKAISMRNTLTLYFEQCTVLKFQKPN